MERVNGSWRVYYRVPLDPNTKAAQLDGLKRQGISRSDYAHEPAKVIDCGDFAVVRLHWPIPTDSKGRFAKEADGALAVPPDAARFANLSGVVEINSLEAGRLAAASKVQ